MIIHILNLLLALFSVASALAIPESENKGLDFIPRTDDTTTVNRTAGPEWPSYYCGCGYRLNPAHTNDAVRILANEINNWYEAGTPFIPHNKAWVVVGDVVAFLCNGGHAITVPAPYYYSSALGEITKRCGSFIAGTERKIYYIPLFNMDYYDWGYMQYRRGLNFCHDAALSPVGHCDQFG